MKRVLTTGASLMALLAIVVGVPLILLTVGNPVAGLSELAVGDVSDRVIVDLLAGLALVAWAQFVVAVMVELVSQLRRVTAPRIPGVFAGQQQVAHALVAAALLSAPVIGTVAPAAVSAQQPGTAVLVTATASVAPIRAATADAPASLRQVVISSEGPGTYWDLARVHLGSGERWREIWELNKGRQQPDGETLSSAGLLRPGWTVLLPDSRATVESAAPTSLVVQRGDTLSSIATAHRVDSWRTLWDLNQDRSQPHGARLRDPDHIEPGWTIALPPAARQVHVERAADEASALPPAPLERLAPASAHRSTSAAPPASAATPVDGRCSDSSEGEHGSTAVLVGAGFGSGLLAGVTLTALLSHRRRQFRYRRPGRAIAGTPAHLVPVERTLITAGGTAEIDVRWVDEALRGLAHTLSRSLEARLPRLLAARLNDSLLELHLAEPSPDAPVGWNAVDAGRRWQLRRGAATGYDAERRGFHFAPYPALASVGYSSDGDQWLVDLEELSAVRLTGDHDRCVRLARFITAELAHNVWSEQLDVLLAGFGAEMADLNPDRLRARSVAEAVNVLTHPGVAPETAASGESDLLRRRLRDIDSDGCVPQVLLTSEVIPAVEDLLTRLAAVGRRSGVVVVAVGAPGSSPGWVFDVDAAGVLRVPALDLELTAHQVGRDEAAALTRLLAETSRRDDVAVAPARGDEPWDEFADAAGALLPAITLNSDNASGKESGNPSELQIATPATPEPSSSVLPRPAAHYTAVGATTEADVQALAPAVAADARRDVEAADPGLDEDLALWLDRRTDVPKLTLLGPVNVVASGSLPETRPRKAWNVEIVAYLASHPRGVTAEQLGTALWPDDPDIAGKSKLRQAIYIARKWLATDPRTGRDILPAATQVAGGPSLYRVVGLLVDAELFRRLRIRGVARGANGVRDLEQALSLVTGPPLAQRRPGGYAWLADVPLDHEYTGMIVDVAHLVATIHLAAGEPSRARAAAEIALRAGSTDDIALLDLVAACDAEGNHAEADRYIQRILANHDAEVEEDLPPRTARILHRRWLDQAS